MKVLFSEIEAVQVHDYAQICFDKAVAYLVQEGQDRMLNHW